MFRGPKKPSGSILPGTPKTHIFRTGFYGFPRVKHEFPTGSEKSNFFQTRPKDELFKFHYGFPRVSHGLLRVFHGFLEIDIFGYQNHDENNSKSSLRLHTFPDFLALGNKYGGGEWQNDCNLIGKSKYMVCIGQIHQREKKPNMNLPH